MNTEVKRYACAYVCVISFVFQKNISLTSTKKQNNPLLNTAVV